MPPRLQIAPQQGARLGYDDAVLGGFHHQHRDAVGEAGGQPLGAAQQLQVLAEALALECAEGAIGGAGQQQLGRFRRRRLAQEAAQHRPGGVG